MHVNECGSLIENLKKAVDNSKDTRAKEFQACQNEKFISVANEVVETANTILNECKLDFEKLSDSESEEHKGLEKEKTKLNNDEQELRKIQKEISDSTDINFIKDKINNFFGKKNKITSNLKNKWKKQNDVEQLKNDLNEKIESLITTITLITVSLNNDNFMKDLNNFLQKFRIITNYPDEKELSGILSKDLGEKFSILNIDLVSDSFEREMIDFLKEYRGRSYSKVDGTNFFKRMEQKIDSLLCIGLTESYTGRLKNYEIGFRDEFRDLRDFLSSHNKVLHFSTALTRLCAIKVLRHLDNCGKFNARDSYIFIRLSTILRLGSTREFIFNAFRNIDQNEKRIYDLCVIECRLECRRNIENVAELEDKLLSCVVT